MGSSDKPVVAFLGPKASYTHQATISKFPDSRYSIEPQEYIKDVFAAIQSGAASHGVVPIENSTNGSVIFTLDLIADLDRRTPDVLVEGEIYLPVRHCLLGHKVKPARGSFVETAAGQRKWDLPWRSSVSQQSDADKGNASATSAPSKEASTETPKPDLSRIQKLFSHPQAWDQCKSFLTTNFGEKFPKENASSTSQAAETVSKDTTGTSAAIASKLAAELFGLDILAEGIEDNPKNTTRFFILRHKDSPPLSPIFPPLSPTAASSQDYSNWKTLITFTVSHTRPGALADSLAALRKHNLNLTSMHTRPSRGENWHYIFFVEFQGRKLAEGEGGSVNEALAELGGLVEEWRWVGSWEGQI